MSDTRAETREGLISVRDVAVALRRSDTKETPEELAEQLFFAADKIQGASQALRRAITRVLAYWEQGDLANAVGHLQDMAGITDREVEMFHEKVY